MTGALREAELPELSILGPEPKLRPAIYERRLEALRRRLDRVGLDAIVVYADREHYANVSYLTGFDPRFEEALLVVWSEPNREPTVLAGNESITLVERAGVGLRSVLCQSLSLPSQDRSTRRRVADALTEAGLERSAKVGMAGWKPIPKEDAPADALALAVPQFVVSEVQAVVDRPLADATSLLCGLDGLRVVNEADQLALHEHRATRASGTVWRIVEEIAPGLTEIELSARAGLVGLPLACHVMCTSGAESVNGLQSPTDRELAIGDRFSTAIGYWGGLSCRAGLVVEADCDALDDYIERFASPYYGAIVTWYEAIDIGVTGGQVSALVADRLRGSEVKTMLGAGHLIHLDEWFDSPFVPDGAHELVSGTALQCDVIPVSETLPHYAANVEDSLALAGPELRDELAVRFPECWARIESRRTFMAGVLGIELAESVLPFSDRQAAFAPALRAPGLLLARD